MSAWELFTWFNVGVLALGSIVVFALFLRTLPELLGSRTEEQQQEQEKEPWA